MPLAKQPESYTALNRGAVKFHSGQQSIHVGHYSHIQQPEGTKGKFTHRGGDLSKGGVTPKPQGSGLGGT